MSTHLRPGLNSEQQRANFIAASRRFWFSRGGDYRRCGALTKAGGSCQRVAIRDAERCPVHARRSRPLDQSQQGQPLTVQEIAKRVRRQATNRLRAAWRRDPWMPGATIAFGADIEHGFREALAYAGQDADAMPPSAADWARWKYRLLVLDRDLPDAWATALGQLRQRIRAAGPPPPGWQPSPAVVSPALGYVVDCPPGPYSKRRRLDRDRTPKTRRATGAAGARPLADTDRARAVLAYATHGQTLAPALAAVREDTETRLALALAFDRLVTGEIDHLAWLEALAVAR